MIKNEQILKCVEAAKRYGAKRRVLFGSAAEDPANARDIDLICEGVEGAAFFSMGAEMDNETLTSVDIVPVPPLTRFAKYNLARGKVLHESR